MYPVGSTSIFNTFESLEKYFQSQFYTSFANGRRNSFLTAAFFFFCSKYFPVTLYILCFFVVVGYLVSIFWFQLYRFGSLKRDTLFPAHVIESQATVNSKSVAALNLYSRHGQFSRREFVCVYEKSVRKQPMKTKGKILASC